MQRFLTDLTNFALTQRLAARIVSAAGVKVDFDELGADSSTLGLWHLHHGGCVGEGTGLEDATGGGHALVNHGATAAEDGYQVTFSPNTYLQASLGSQPAQAVTTLEAWIRACGMPSVGGERALAYYSDLAGYNWVDCLLYRAGTTDLRMRGRCVVYVGGQFINWTAEWADNAALTALVSSPDPWHAAVVAEAGVGVRLYVNGHLRAGNSGAVPTFPAMDALLDVGCRSSGYGATAVVDEVRLSKVARYSADFTPRRLAASGTCTSPTFDTLRFGSVWTDLVRAQLMPGGTGITWEVRAADALDTEGSPQASWQECSGDPPSLPIGRYLQWRASLAASTNRMASPTIESAEAQASDAGYNLYHATGAGPESLGYDDPWRRVGPSVTQVATEPLTPGAVHWFAARPVEASGDELPVAQDEVRLELGASGAAVPDRPASPLSVAARAVAGGAVRLVWRYRVGRSAVAPHAFHIFGDGGSGTINYGVPLAVVPHAAGQRWFTWTSGPLASDIEHQLAVRAVAPGGTWDESPAVARITPDAAPPAAVDALQAETLP